jgi:hypothetical protein
VSKPVALVNLPLSVKNIQSREYVVCPCKETQILSRDTDVLSEDLTIDHSIIQAYSIMIFIERYALHICYVRKNEGLVANRKRDELYLIRIQTAHSR